LRKWERGEYCPREISEFWIPRTRVDHLLKTMLSIAEEDDLTRRVKPEL